VDIVVGFEFDFVVFVGFMKFVGLEFLGWFGGWVVNIYLVLLLVFLGMWGLVDVLEYGVKVIGCMLFVVDVGVDIGLIVAQ